MLNVIICGINGAVGELVYQSALGRGHNVICGIDNIRVGKTECPVYNDFDQIRDLADVIIDFSSPDALDSLLNFATENSMPIVIGTTGYSKLQENLICSTAKKIPIFKCANMSLGVNLLTKLCSIAYATLTNFDVEIIEKHHNRKKDSPSGTANLIKDSLKVSKATESCLDNANRRSDVAIHSIRGGSITGEHSVLFMGENETITLTHTAHSKKLFADGAILASEFIAGKQAGLYCMDNLIESDYFSSL